MKYFYLLFLILSLFSFTLEQPTNYLLRGCLAECRRLSNPQNKIRCQKRCYEKYGGH